MMPKSGLGTTVFFFARTEHPVLAARRATHLPEEGAQGACMNSHAVGPRCPKCNGTAATPPPGVRRLISGPPGCQPRDTGSGATPTRPPAPGGDGLPTATRGLQFLQCTPPQVRPLRVTPFEGASQGWRPQARHHLRLAKPQGP